jgi:ferredoxin
VSSERFVVDWARCTGHLVCAELVPELIDTDDWGYPIIAAGPIPGPLHRYARRAKAACPALALRLAPAEGRHGGDADL